MATPERGESARILASRDGKEREPLLTIGIPNYKRREYLEVNLKSLFAQTADNFEILVSDDCSGDDSNSVIPPLLTDSGRPFRYYAQDRNLGYDANVRFCLRNARGRYVFMLGNDDALAGPETTAQIENILRELEFPEVAVTNYKDWESHKVNRRAFGNMVLGAGPAAAAHYFRSFSFTSGLIFDRRAASVHETDKWDRSIYYQIYLGCRILASGGRLGGVDLTAVLDHIRLDGELVPETYRVRYKNAPLSFKHVHTGLDSVARVTIDAVSPFVDAATRSALVRRVYAQLLTMTYPFWLFEYRELANWGWSFGIARDLWPANRLREYDLRLRDETYLWLLYAAVTTCGLTFPSTLFNQIRGPLASWARRRRQQLIR